jgi:hypothetical protein
MTPVVEGKVRLEAHLDVVFADRLVLRGLTESRCNRIHIDSEPLQPMHAGFEHRLVHLFENQPILQAAAKVGFRFRCPHGYERRQTHKDD